MASSIAYEPFDAPMHDFSEEAEMTNLGSSDNTWFPPHAKMEEDHPHHQMQPETQDIDLTGQYPGGVEVDMTFEETTEYEMADASATQIPVDGVHELVDAELYDASAESVVPIPLDPPQPQFSAMGYTEHPIPIPEIAENHYVQDVSFTSDHAPPADAQVEPVQEEQVTFIAEPVAPSLPEVPQPEPQKTAESHAHHGDLPAAGHIVHEADSHAANPEEPSALSRQHSLHPSEVPVEVPAEGGPSLESQNVVIASEVHPEVVEAIHQPEPEPHNEQPIEQSAPFHEDGAEVAPSVHESEHVEQTEVVEESGALQSHAPEVHYVEVPPILLSLHLSSLEGEQPEFALFASPVPPNEDVSEETLVLLQHRPELYFEPISTVFDALRQEQYFSHIEELVESEMILNVYDLQLVIGEDNVYAREVSLHDMAAMHTGLGMAGYLRVALQSFVPRFISRYNLLRDQLAQLISSTNANEEQPVATENHTDVTEKITESIHQEVPTVSPHTKENKPTQDSGASSSEPEQSHPEANDDVDNKHEETNDVGHNEETDPSSAHEAQESAEVGETDTYQADLQESPEDSEDYDDGLVDGAEQAEVLEGGELQGETEEEQGEEEEEEEGEETNDFVQEVDETSEVITDISGKDHHEHEQSQQSVKQDEQGDVEEVDDDEFSPLPSEDGDILEDADSQEFEKDPEFVEDVDGATNDTVDAHDSSHSADDQGDVISANSGTGTSTLDTEHGTQEAGLDDTENDQFPDSKLGSDDDAYGEYYEEDDDDSESHAQQASLENEEISSTPSDIKTTKLRKRSYEDLEEVLEQPSTHDQKKARTS